MENGVCLNGYVCIIFNVLILDDPNTVLNANADVPAMNGARISAATVLTTKLSMCVPWELMEHGQETRSRMLPFCP